MFSDDVFFTLKTIRIYLYDNVMLKAYHCTMLCYLIILVYKIRFVPLTLIRRSINMLSGYCE